MLRWAVAGLALFSVGMAAGGLVHHQLMSAPSPDARALTQTDASAAPAAVALEKPVVPALPAVETVVAHEPTLDRVEDNNLIKPVVAMRPSVGEVLIAAVKPDQQSQAERVAPVQRAEVTIARVRTTNSTLRDNPIVQRELTRDIQQELYRVGCHSVVVSGRWDARTVKASTKFVANRNAVLPADRPDVILLSLLRSYRGGDCGKSQQVASTGPNLIAPAVNSAAVGSPAAVAQPGTGPVIAPVVKQPSRATTGRATRRRKRTADRKKRRSWRNQVHYGTGSDY